MIGAASAWRLLGLVPGDDTGAIRRAYAERLRAMDVDADPDGFARLREARDIALKLARSGGVPAEDVSDTVDEEAAIEVDAARSLTLAPVSLDRTDATGTLDVMPSPIGTPPPLAPPRGPGKTQDLPLDPARFQFLAEVPDGLSGGDVLVRAPDADDRANLHFGIVRDLLQPDDCDTPLVPEQIAILHDSLIALLADSRLDNVSFHADAEQWFAETLARAVPRSDPMLRIVANRFGWDAAASIHQSPAITSVADRLATLDFAAAVAQPGHRHHGAWRVLTDTDHARRHWFGASRSRQRRLLAEIRQHHPGVEPLLDPYRVSKIEGRSIGGPGPWIWGILGWALLKLILALTYGTPFPETSRAPAPVPVATAPVLAAGQSAPLGDMTADLDQALLAFANGLDWATTQRSNPKLALAMERRWHDARASGTSLADFIHETQDYLWDRYRAAIPHAAYDDIRELRTIQRAELAAAGSRSATACDDYRHGRFDPSPFLSDSTRAARSDVRRRILLAETNLVRQPDEDRRYIIPEEVVDEVKRKTRLSEEALKDAFADKGTPEARCQMRLALFDAALALPPAKGLKLLRDM